MSSKKFIQPKNHIILALDTVSELRGFEVLEQTFDLVDCVKLNYPLVLKEGLGIIKRIKDNFGLKVFADFKVSDVPVTNDRIIKIVAEHGAFAIMVHGIIGPDALESAVEAANGEICLVVQTEFTSSGGAVFTQGIANSLAQLARELGCHAVQAPGNRPERISEIKKIVGDDLRIVCCGVGAQGGTYNDVLRAGGDFAIIGRSIYQSTDPRQVLIDILNEEPAQRNSHAQ